eukprot:6657465-Pyramimonas_sp.AAC.1
MLRGVFPLVDWGGQQFAEGDPRAAPVGGSSLGFRGVVVQLQLDWEAVCSLFGVAFWSDARAPCPLCSACKSTMHRYRTYFLFTSEWGDG